jgi:hypothetical protein
MLYLLFQLTYWIMGNSMVRISPAVDVWWSRIERALVVIITFELSEAVDYPQVQEECGHEDFNEEEFYEWLMEEMSSHGHA